MGFLAGVRGLGKEVRDQLYVGLSEAKPNISLFFLSVCSVISVVKRVLVEIFQ